MQSWRNRASTQKKREGDAREPQQNKPGKRQNERALAAFADNLPCVVTAAKPCRSLPGLAICVHSDGAATRGRMSRGGAEEGAYFAGRGEQRRGPEASSPVARAGRLALLPPTDPAAPPWRLLRPVSRAAAGRVRRAVGRSLITAPPAAAQDARHPLPVPISCDSSIGGDPDEWPLPSAFSPERLLRGCCVGYIRCERSSPEAVIASLLAHKGEEVLAVPADAPGAGHLGTVPRQLASARGDSAFAALVRERDAADDLLEECHVLGIDDPALKKRKSRLNRQLWRLVTAARKRQDAAAAGRQRDARDAPASAPAFPPPPPSPPLAPLGDQEPRGVKQQRMRPLAANKQRNLGAAAAARRVEQAMAEHARLQQEPNDAVLSESWAPGKERCEPGAAWVFAGADAQALAAAHGITLVEADW